MKKIILLFFPIMLAAMKPESFDHTEGAECARMTRTRKPPKNPSLVVLDAPPLLYCTLNIDKRCKNSETTLRKEIAAQAARGLDFMVAYYHYIEWKDALTSSVGFGLMSLRRFFERIQYDVSDEDVPLPKVCTLNNKQVIHPVFFFSCHDATTRQFTVRGNTNQFLKDKQAEKQFLDYVRAHYLVDKENERRESEKALANNRESLKESAS